MKQSVFVVRRFKNRNGAFSWRVQGTLNGVRMRRNFKTHEEATTVWIRRKFGQRWT